MDEFGEVCLRIKLMVNVGKSKVVRCSYSERHERLRVRLGGVVPGLSCLRKWRDGSGGKTPIERKGEYARWSGTPTVSKDLSIASMVRMLKGVVALTILYGSEI